MNKVSRSFALVVPFAEEPLNHYLATAYLICRVVDNIEDSGLPPPQKRTRFAEFTHLLKYPSMAPDVLTRWEQGPWPGLTIDEKQLMSLENGLMLWQIYAQTPDEVREIIARWTLTMAKGMSQIDDPHQTPQLVDHKGVKVLAREDDYNRYCYFVAGTVGHMATELVIHHYGLTNDVARPLLAKSEACGRGLQKTNIVKDFPKDLARGVSYLPDEWMTEIDHAPLSLAGAPIEWKQAVIDNVLNELEDSVEYLLNLPYWAAGYRMASLLCLLPAYQTMLKAAQDQETLFTTDHQVKISREVMAQCLQDAQTMVVDNEAIREYSQDIRWAIETEFKNSLHLT